VLIVKLDYLLLLIFDFKTVNVGGLSVWIFGVVVWESRELAGREREYVLSF